MEARRIPTPEELAQKLKFAAVVSPLPESDWPSMGRVAEEYPHLCSEEQCWILESLLVEAHKRKGQNEGDN